MLTMTDFERMELLHEKVSEEDQKKMVAEIIEVMKPHNITYNQAHAILAYADVTLTNMSQKLLM